MHGRNRLYCQAQHCKAPCQFHHIPLPLQRRAAGGCSWRQRCPQCFPGIRPQRLPRSRGTLISSCPTYFIFQVPTNLDIDTSLDLTLVFSCKWWQTEGLKQLTSMGSLVLCCGDGAVMNSTNLYAAFTHHSLISHIRLLINSSYANSLRGLLRHGVSIWIDIPLELVVNDMLKTQATSDPDSFSEVHLSSSCTILFKTATFIVSRFLHIIHITLATLCPATLYLLNNNRLQHLLTTACEYVFKYTPLIIFSYVKHTASQNPHPVAWCVASLGWLHGWLYFWLCRCIKMTLLRANFVVTWLLNICRSHLKCHVCRQWAESDSDTMN